MTEQSYSGGPFLPSFGAGPSGRPLSNSPSPALPGSSRPGAARSQAAGSGSTDSGASGAGRAAAGGSGAGTAGEGEDFVWPSRKRNASKTEGTSTRRREPEAVPPGPGRNSGNGNSGNGGSSSGNGNGQGSDSDSDDDSGPRKSKRRVTRRKSKQVEPDRDDETLGEQSNAWGDDRPVKERKTKAKRSSKGKTLSRKAPSRGESSRGDSKSKSATDSDLGSDSGLEGDARSLEEGAAESNGAVKKSRRRGKRGGRRRKKSGDDASDSNQEAATDLQADPDAQEEKGRSPSRRESLAEENRPAARKRGSRGGRKRKKSAAVEVEGIPGEEDDLPELADLPDEAVLVDENPKRGGRKKRVSSSRRRNSSRSEDDEENVYVASARRKKASKKTTKKTAKASSAKATKRTKQSKKSRSSRVEEEDAYAHVRRAPAEPGTPRQILVNAIDPEETRVVVVEEGRIVDLQMTAKKHVTYVSDIFRGRVVNLEPAIGAAFVDFGQGKNGFLHASDVLPCYGEPDFQLDQLLTTPVEADDWSGSSQPDVHAELDDIDSDATDQESSATGTGRKAGRSSANRGRGAARSQGRTRRPRMPIEKLVKKGQMICAQITKDAIGDKGPTLTTYISIPGRYLVLMPSLARTGVSRKIDDDRERRRLKRILQSLKIPDGMGVIVRTAGVGRTKAELKRDLDYLLAAWEDFSRRLVSGRNPAPLYQESDVAIKTMRDLFTSNVETVTVDDPGVYERVIEFTKKLMPEHLERIKLHEGSRPLLQTFSVEPDFEKIFSKRVELPSGGSIVIEQTEALVAIDVNSGRTREEGAGFEDIALKTNLEAVPEIARQIRLRDLGGIIVLDYIDMMRASSRRAVERATREGLANDRARSKVGRISQFGLLELTRQRLGPGLDKLVYETCKTCRGSGRRRSASSRAQAILRRLGASLTLKGFTSVEVRAHPDAIEYLEKTLSKELERLGDDSGRKIVLLPVPDQVEDSVLHYLRADGREVRPGGRRKRR